LPAQQPVQQSVAGAAAGAMPADPAAGTGIGPLPPLQLHHEWSVPARDGGYSIDAFRHLRGNAFLFAAYRALLGRDPDEQGFAYFRRAMGQGQDQADILIQLATSAEGRARGVHLLGAGRYRLARRLERLPVLGTVVRFTLALYRLPDAMRRDRANEALSIQLVEDAYGRIDGHLRQLHDGLSASAAAWLESRSGAVSPSAVHQGPPCERAGVTDSLARVVDRFSSGTIDGLVAELDQLAGAVPAGRGVAILASALQAVPLAVLAGGQHSDPKSRAEILGDLLRKRGFGTVHIWVIEAPNPIAGTVVHALRSA
jgi:Domain of unknown function (DUF4214)